jgi:hypothetical protein
VAVRAPVELLPLVGIVPLQSPEAVHEVAFVELQLMVEALPPVTLLGDALSDTVGVGAAVAPEPCEQAESARDAPIIRPAAPRRPRLTCQQETFMRR